MRAQREGEHVAAEQRKGSPHYRRCEARAVLYYSCAAGRLVHGDSGRLAEKIAKPSTESADWLLLDTYRKMKEKE